MKTCTKICLSVVLTAIITSVSTAHFLSKDLRNAWVKQTVDMEALNGINRIRAWDCVERLLTQRLYKEASDYVKSQQSTELSSLKYYLEGGAKFDANVEESNLLLISRAKSFTHEESHNLPTCVSSLGTS